MNNRERVRLFMAHLRQTRRAVGLCARCGLVYAQPGQNCDECNRVRRIERSFMVVTTLQVPSTSLHTVST